MCDQVLWLPLRIGHPGEGTRSGFTPDSSSFLPCVITQFYLLSISELRDPASFLVKIHIVLRKMQPHLHVNIL